MLSNAVSTALERLYATTPVADAHSAVQRIAAVSRVRSLTEDGPTTGSDDRDARHQAEQRQALTQGVRAVFETAFSADAAGSGALANGSGRSEGAADALDPDPGLEEAILRFIHTIFRTLAEVDGEPVALILGADASRVATAAWARPTLANNGADDGANDRAVTGASASRGALGARIGALAQRYAQSVSAEALSDPATKVNDAASFPVAARNEAGSTAPETDVRNISGSGSSVPDPALSQAFADVLQALRGNNGGAEIGPGSRGELVNLMQRLARAMQGAPPMDPGLPTRGGLLSTRA